MMDTPQLKEAAFVAQAANTHTVTMVLPRLQAKLDALGDASPMRGYLSYGSLRVTLAQSTVFVPLSAWALMPLAQALVNAVADIRGSHEPLVVCFANTSWRLLIACRNVAMPDFGDGKSFGSLTSGSNLAMLARLHTQPHGKTEPNSTALRAWHAVVASHDEDAISLFLSTALAHSMPISTLPSASTLSELHEEWDEPLPEHDPPDGEHA